MKKKITIHPDQPAQWWLYAGFWVLGIWLYRDGRLTVAWLVLMMVFVTSILLFNRYLWRVEMDEQGVTGPSKRGVMVRIHIPWKEARARIEHVKGLPFFRFLGIVRNGSDHEIRISLGNFSGKAEANLRALIKEYLHHGEVGM